MGGSAPHWIARGLEAGSLPAEGETPARPRSILPQPTLAYPTLAYPTLAYPTRRPLALLNGCRADSGADNATAAPSVTSGSPATRTVTTCPLPSSAT